MTRAPRPAGRRAALALGLLMAWAWAWPGAGAAQTVLDLTLDEARLLAVQAVLAGDASLAREVASALLDADPDDRAALVVLAAAEPRLGRPRAGRLAAARAWELSATRAQRHEAARLAAAAAAGEGRTFLAEVWLRRALAAAPDEEREARTLADARALRAHSPWAVTAELGFQPSDNVNGGAETPFNVIDGLPFVGIISVDGRALSGWAGTADLAATRRLSESARQRTELSFRLWGRAVALSEESRELIEAEREAGGPEVEGSDFASAQAELRVGHRRATGWGLAGGDLSLARSWHGEEAPTTSLRLSGLAALALSEARSLRLSAHAEGRREGGGRGGQVRAGAELAWGTRLRGSDHLTLALSRSATFSDSGNQASDGWGIRASYALGEPVGPARLGATLGASWTGFPDYAVIFPVPGGRRDERVFGRLEAAFEGWSHAGFAPVLSIEAARSDSNVSRFDTESLGLGITLRSTF